MKQIVLHYGDRWHRWRTCKRKVAYDEPKKRHIQAAEEEGLRYYRCTFCGYWHLTKQKQPWKVKR